MFHHRRFPTTNGTLLASHLEAAYQKKKPVRNRYATQTMAEKTQDISFECDEEAIIDAAIYIIRQPLTSELDKTTQTEKKNKEND